MLETTYYKSPIGILEIKGDKNGIQSVLFVDDNVSIPKENSTLKELTECVVQLEEYFLGTRKEFTLDLNIRATPFQEKVWRELLKVPFGSSRTYLEQSKKLGDPKAIRAVGTANGKNPISIIVPCHRIIGSNGSLTGYAGGIWRKKWLLEHESGSKQQSLF